MSEREKTGERFLERWSRRKIESEREAPAPVPDERNEEGEAAPTPAVLRQDSDVASAPAPDGFDLSKLPSLDSITAATDIRGFLAPGVPREIARAALRRAWAADPAIRDFKGLAENDWDFTDPAAMPGFGGLPAGTDIKKMVAQIFGEGTKEEMADAVQAEPEPRPAEIAKQLESPADPSVAPDERAEQSSEAAPEQAQTAEANIVHRNSIAALHNNNADDEPAQPELPRRHGRALPQ